MSPSVRRPWRCRVGLLFVAFLLLGLGAPRLAPAQTVTPGYVAHFEDLGGVRYKSFASGGDREVYLGVPDLGTGSNRGEVDFIWSSPASHPVTFTYDQPSDTLVTTVGTVTLTYPNFASQAAAKGKTSTVCDLDIMQITVKNGHTGTTVKLENVVLDGHALGTFDGLTGPNVYLDWMVTDYDFGHGFTLTGTLTLGGTFSGGNEVSRVEIKVGRSTDPGGVAPAIGPLSSCNDDEPCTIDSCSATLGCQYVSLADSTACDDGSLCTTGETCLSGVCGTPTSTVTCSAVGQCYDAGACDPLTGICSNPPKPPGAPCGNPSSGGCDNADTCDGAGACQQNHVVNGTGCDDTDSCTSSDTCTNGLCAGTLGQCGDGTTQPGCGEQCDDGNIVPDDGCSATCTLEPCGPAPATGCAQPTVSKKALLLLKDKSPDDKDNLVWKWTKGAATEKQDFGAPLQNDDYWFCVYHGATPALVSRARIPAAGTCAGSKPCWKENRNGFTYKNRDRTPHGVSGIVLKQGAAGKAKVVVKGKGTNLSMPTLTAVTAPVVVQLKNLGNGKCWEATYGAPFVKQTTSVFKAKAD